jgi:G3E family GTPase
VIETTGLADPAPILHTLMTDPLVAARFRLDGVVTTVDAVHGESQLDAQPEPVKQAAVADRIVLTKTDIAEPKKVEALEERLRRLNPAAPIERATLGQIDPRKLMDCGLYDPRTKTADVTRWLNEEAYAAGHGHGHDHHHHDHDHEHHDHAKLDVNRHDDRIRAFCLSFDRPFQWTEIAEALDLFAQTHGPNLLRVKGILNVVESEKPIVVHGVQHLFHPPATLSAWPPGDDKRSRLVFITRDLDKEYVEKSLDALFKSHAPA